ncbi:solute carrier family 35 member B1 homolog isoform X2 [Leguminivora glycinivorella]|uniref:solute carrier family 35 member B1 homolog isoform X2 n=1 Tax=Leguminivora glycinivorella TaxID=1035111 RepID=UPI00200E50F9|nr:solute carrier family 35 member B1 homolog isoform X2 [Leguminivora glycinivorella]
MAKPRSEFRFIFFAGGIFICYFIFGMLQEKITRGLYGDNEQFTCTLSLVLVQCVVNYIFAQILMLSWKHETDTTRKIYYFSSALTYLLGMVSSNMALQWINYPTQVVGKAAKPIPVMILGVLIGRKVYPLKKYLFVFLIVLGVVIFMFKDQSKKVAHESQGLGVGELMLFLSLIMDGLTGAVQERMKSESSPSAYSMMVNSNGWSSIILSIGVLLTGEMFRFITFVSKYPEVLVHLAGLAFMGALGQLFIFFMVSEFGPLPCSVVTTTRKFFTVLASVLIFGNVLLGRQWIGATIVFTGLFLDIFYSKGKGQVPKKKKKHKNE